MLSRLLNVEFEGGRFMIEGPAPRQSLLILCLLVWVGGESKLDAQSFRITHLAGTTGGGGYADGQGSSARFNRLIGATADSAGNVYIADSSNHVIRKISPAGVVSTLAGTPGKGGSDDGTGSAALFAFPQGIAVDRAGNLYVADSTVPAIRKITSDGVVTTLAGSPGKTGTADGTGSEALFTFPSAIATDSAGNVYVADGLLDSNFNDVFATIRKVTPAGVVTTLAGSPSQSGSTDGTGSSALFAFGASAGLVADTAGNIYVADTDSNTIRKVTPAGVVTTIAGTPGFPGSLGFGTRDGTGPDAQFESPFGITIDAAGNLFVSDGGASTIRRVTPDGVVTTFAGTPNAPGFVGGIGAAASFNGLNMLGSDGTSLYVPDTGNNAVRKIDVATAAVTTLAGGSPIENGSADGIGAAARFNLPSGLATDGTNLYVTDIGFVDSSAANSTIRRISLANGQVTTLAGTPLVTGSSDGVGAAARFNQPRALATDGTNLYVADTNNSTIRQIALSTGQVATLAGVALSPGTTDGTGVAARFSQPQGIATDGTNLYVADTLNSTIRRVVIATGEVTTLVGSPGVAGSSDGIGGVAHFANPRGIATDGASLYVCDAGNQTIRQVVVATGQVSTLAGTAGVTGSTDGIGTAALFSGLHGIATDGTNLYVTDGQTLRTIVIATGLVVTRAGTAGWLGGQDGAGAGPRLFPPNNAASDVVFVGNAAYIADGFNAAIRRAVCGADDPVSPAITPIGNSTAPVTGVDFLNLTWSPPASGLTPNGYDWAINGDPFTPVAGTSVTAPPRNSNDPITLHVRGRACNPEVAGTAVDSETSSPAPPVASFTASGPVAPGATITFTDTSEPQATSWLWLFGDGAFATTQSATHTFSSAGIYTVVLVATNGAGSSETSHPQTVQSISVAPQQILSMAVFDALNPQRQRLEGVRLAGPGDARLHIISSEKEEAIVYLQLLDDSDKLGKERRLSIGPGQEAVYDVGAYGLRGTWTLELVSGRKFEAFVEVHPSSDGPRKRGGESR
jgi:sugar lactone lactonase YvrE/plastocyanin